MTTTNTSEKAVRGTQPVRLPPEEKFWQRYSPHQEMPLSTITSFGLHLLGIGGLFLFAWLGWFGFGKSDNPLPVETVRFELPSGGGANEHGSGTNKGVGKVGAEPVATTQEKPDDPTPPIDNDKERTKLDPTALASNEKLAIQKDDTFVRYIQEGNPNTKIFQTIDATALSKLRDGLNPGKGRGGAGKDGGKGAGTGTGDGDANGPGKTPKGALSNREKRMLRWSMIFDTRSGQDYLNQLHSLGAILGIPVGDGKSYKIVRELGKRPAPLLDEDISKIQRIFWIDDRPESVASIMQVIGYPMTPVHFVAFMPETLEQEMFELEKKYRGRSEDQIHETKFRAVRKSDGKYHPVVIEQTGR
jgi:hypothetical protein